ncbi:hypothetical protein GCM10023169_11800 [Georgenia halophila]|uniref:ATP synthase protein I n=1 Tax=Georgenia halophila TaxID=620889 RepID=A0ABP8KW55_9MICO
MTTPSRSNGTSTALRQMYTTMLRRMGVLVAVLAVGGGVVGHLVAGSPGMWGALLGAGIAALFMLATVVTMLVTAEKSLTVVTGAAVGGWIVKMALVFVVLLLVSGRDFYSPGVFFAVLVVAVLGSLLIESLGVLRSRVPTVEPSSSAPSAASASTSTTASPATSTGDDGPRGGGPDQATDTEPDERR